MLSPLESFLSLCLSQILFVGLNWYHREKDLRGALHMPSKGGKSFFRQLFISFPRAFSLLNKPGVTSCLALRLREGSLRYSSHYAEPDQAMPDFESRSFRKFASIWQVLVVLPSLHKERSRGGGNKKNQYEILPHSKHPIYLWGISTRFFHRGKVARLRVKSKSIFPILGNGM